MRDDKIKRVCVSDLTIVDFGARMFQKNGHVQKSWNDISCKMRDLGRLLLELRKLDRSGSGATQLGQYLRPQGYDLLVKGVRAMSQWNESSNVHGIPSVAIRIGIALNKCAQIVLMQAIKDCDKGREEEVRSFKALMPEWTHDVSSHAHRNLYNKQFNKESALPLADDLQAFHNFP